MCEKDEGNGQISIFDLPGELLIIPQATLGGRLNGNRFQYHQNISKEIGFELFTKLIEILRNAYGEDRKHFVQCGTYGIRQVYSTETNGPAMHLIEI